MMKKLDHRMTKLQHTLSGIPDCLVRHHNEDVQSNVIFGYNVITLFLPDEILRIDLHLLRINLFVVIVK